MADGAIPIPGDFLAQVFDHVEKTGTPLLRKRLPDDVHTVLAVLDTHGSFNLTLNTEYDTEDLGGWVENCGHMADYFGLSVEELLEELDEAGFPWMPDLGDVDYEMEEYDEERGIDDPASLDEAAQQERQQHRIALIEQLIFSEPNDARDYLRHLLPGPTLAEVLDGATGLFVWDSATTPPGQPPAEARGDDGSLNLGGVAVTHERRSGVGEAVCWVPSAVSLSCLQFALDSLSRNVWIKRHHW
jgi:hypothetical protein